MNNIRKITNQDLTHLKEVIDSTELFPSELLDDMTHDYLINEKSTDIWLTREEEEEEEEEDGIPIVVAYCAPERMTEGTYNLYLIAVSKNHQGQGIGTEMMQYVENILRESGHRILLVETSGLADFGLTRKFYDKLGYKREAVIREFYQDGEDKVVFWKKISK